ncbi:UPF0029-domain-containing protein [Testicularia cyperi]|uniref:UPF0029-domain-containing protein n=1 Tax=Testicularia cyperi TaxID=1882483 RepID=A0A317XJY1_9BASI|nr:UPF0029-domain-containing protein [Testicularia cyperi]
MEDIDDSPLGTLIERLESYAADPSSLSIPGPSTRHPDWIQDEAQRTEATSQLAEELMALQSIYTDEALHLLKITPLGVESKGPTSPSQDGAADPASWLPGSKLTVSISTEFEPTSSGEDPIPIRLAATLPSFYPHSSRPPQLQLLSRYVGGFSVDSRLFGEILRAFYHQTDGEGDGGVNAGDDEDAIGTSPWVGGSMENGVHWRKGEVILFEERTTNYDASNPSTSEQPSKFKGVLHQTPSIIERKSEFIGYAARISSPDEVDGVLSLILSDKRVARATHPIINAWVCKTWDGVIHRDCDDDGETAAGGRLAHLLGILELENVIVVVTRWYGGIHLGPDRFKLINRAAREALDLGGFVGKNGDDTSRSKGMGKRNT